MTLKDLINSDEMKRILITDPFTICYISCPSPTLFTNLENSLNIGSSLKEEI